VSTERWDFSWQHIERAACSRCGQPPGERCRTPAGKLCPPHRVRKDDAAALGYYVPGRGSLVPPERDG